MTRFGKHGCLPSSHSFSGYVENIVNLATVTNRVVGTLTIVTF